jgi:FkbM family methyltransferase
VFNFIRDLILKIIPRWRFMNTYSQAGEDVIAWYFFTTQGIKNPTYLDIGTNDPIYGNNTFLLYKRGSKGVCIEADPSLFPTIKSSRSKDICINAAVTFDARTNADFYVFDEPAHNTLSKEEAEYRNNISRYKIKEVINIPLVNINTLIKDNFKQAPNFISIDVEGVDFDILKTLDFNTYRPDMLCVETVTFSLDNKEEKMEDIIAFMKTKNYIVYADTHINTLFVDKKYFPTYQ